MKMRELRIEHIVVGTGAAGFQAALCLNQKGERDLAVVTEDVNSGTSRNTGSDKQTYYKLSLGGPEPDSVGAMAQDLFRGQCVDGDLALCEAALSARCFFRLTELGVPFPCTEFGEFMGYRTDHDSQKRATSAGPYTSKLMTECLEKRVREQGIRIMDQMQAVRILVREKRVYGILCLDRSQRKEASYLIIWCRNLILATGGPAGMYRDSVYPVSQLGASGMAFEAGIGGKNLTEWQFGLASLRPRWNVSGTYMQALPGFISADQEGRDQREFLMDYFETPEEMLSMVFLKGYQWPFDVNRIGGGSSVIDLLVYRETILKGRRVYLDFRRNPGNRKIRFERMAPEACEYLKQAGALLGTPIERLEKMNGPAVRFYEEHGVDLHEELLEIAVCAQHNNGGLATDAGWETNIRGIFAVGEVCGSHGVARPGGSALNAGQAGALRAAERIYLRKLHGGGKPRDGEMPEKELRSEAEEFVKLPDRAEGQRLPGEMWAKASGRMSAWGGMIREKEKLEEALAETEEELRRYGEIAARPDVSELSLFYRLRDMLISQKVYLFAMVDYVKRGGGSRGSALYTDRDGKDGDEKLPRMFRCTRDEGALGQVIQEVFLEGDVCRAGWRPVRPIPQTDYFFENQWKRFREMNEGPSPDFTCEK